MKKTSSAKTKTSFSYVIPSVLAFALSGVYTIVDGLFIGRSLGDIGLAAFAAQHPDDRSIFLFCRTAPASVGRKRRGSCNGSGICAGHCAGCSLSDTGHRLCAVHPQHGRSDLCYGCYDTRFRYQYHSRLCPCVFCRWEWREQRRQQSSVRRSQCLRRSSICCCRVSVTDASRLSVFTMARAKMQIAGREFLFSLDKSSLP